jgi:hypothetical protein
MSAMRRALHAAVTLLLLACPAMALDVAGVSLAPSVTVNGKTLTFNGAGIRKKLFVKVYVGSLYAGRRISSRDELLTDPGDKLIRMNYLYSKVGRGKVVETFAEGFANNAPDVSALPEARAFLSFFTADFVSGDVVDITVGGDGTVTAIHNGRILGSARSLALARGVLLIWFGDKPADEGLKNGMLGRK